MLRHITLVGVVAALLAGCSSAAAAGGASPTESSTGGDGQCQGTVAVTFDDGPTAKTGELAQALQQAGMTATFFNVGAKAEANPAAVAAETAVGAVENHTYTHPFLDEMDPQAAADEILGTSQIIAATTNTPVTYWRAPFNRFTAQNMADASSQGLRHVSWTIDTDDWSAGASVESITAALANIQDQDIILMHDGYDTTVAAIPHIATLLKSKGLCTGKLANSDTPIVSSWGDQSFVKVVR